MGCLSYSNMMLEGDKPAIVDYKVLHILCHFELRPPASVHDRQEETT